MMSLVSLFVAVSLAAPFASAQGGHGGILRSADSVSNHTYDFIICGGGLSGLVVANRLTQASNISVLVIEAGEDRHEDPRVNDVRTYGQAFGTELDHGIYSTPIKWQNGRRELLVAGKMLGGSGSLNGATWTKGAKSQYDLLAEVTGDKTWGWDSFNEYMLDVENFTPPNEDQRDYKGANHSDEYHGTGGPVQVSFGSGMFGGTQRPALEAAQKVWQGLERRPDLAAGIANGASIVPNMVHSDESQNRSSPFTAYVQHQMQERDNLHILTGHRVTEIVWSPEQYRVPTKEWPEKWEIIADGVLFQASPDAPVHTVHARREVILAAGSLQSPQILELSGVGHPDVLTAAGIDPKHTIMGVGKNMQEQTKNTLVFEAKPGTSFNGTGTPSALAFVTAPQVLGKNTREHVIMEDTRWWKLENIDTIPDYAAELEEKGLVVNSKAAARILLFQNENLFQAPDSAAAEIFFTIDPKANTVGADIWNLIVLSRGTCHVTSKDPWTHPTVEPNYFLHPFDLAIQTRAVEQTRQVFHTSPLKEYIAKELTPGAINNNTEEWVKQTFTSVWHYLGTLAMMKQELGGVVSNRLKVYGIHNVRVVDASVMPIQLSAHLSSTLYGVAEKAADMIKEDLRLGEWRDEPDFNMSEGEKILIDLEIEEGPAPENE